MGSTTKISFILSFLVLFLAVSCGDANETPDFVDNNHLENIKDLPDLDENTLPTNWSPIVFKEIVISEASKSIIQPSAEGSIKIVKFLLDIKGELGFDTPEGMDTEHLYESTDWSLYGVLVPNFLDGKWQNVKIALSDITFNSSFVTTVDTTSIVVKLIRLEDGVILDQIVAELPESIIQKPMNADTSFGSQLTP